MRVPLAMHNSVGQFGRSHKTETSKKVRVGSQANILGSLRDVRFSSESGHRRFYENTS
jgi:hypothetical protein